jgi:DNA-binding FrmR family transcriptional regulator
MHNHHTHGYLHNKAGLAKRMARVEGQVRGISRMIEEERYCIDILTQLAAVETALRRVGLQVLEEHVQSCVADALRSGNQPEADIKTAELLASVNRFIATR